MTTAPLIPLPTQPEHLAWPTETWPEAFASTEFDRARAQQAIDFAFSQQALEKMGETHAFLAVHKGQVVLERYAEGHDQTSTFPSWSKAKSITQALVGILVRAGKSDIHAPADVLYGKALTTRAARSRWTSSCACRAG